MTNGELQLTKGCVHIPPYTPELPLIQEDIMEQQLATRHNQGKTKWSLVDFQAIEDMVRVLMFGEAKYGRCNWKKGLPVTEICDSLQRHLYAFLDGQDNDEETGVSHIGHIMCNAMFLSYVMKHKKELDDRWS